MDVLTKLPDLFNLFLSIDNSSIRFPINVLALEEILDREDNESV